MIDIETYPLLNVAGNPKGANLVQSGGKFFMVLSAASALNIQLYRNQDKVADAVGVPAGIPFRIPKGFTSWAAQFTSPGAGSILAGTDDDDVGFNFLTGTVNAITLGGSGLTSTADMMATAGVQTALKAANAARRTIIITSLHSNTGYARVGDASTGATQGTELQPGQSVSLDTTAAVYVFDAIADKFSILEVLA